MQAGQADRHTVPAPDREGRQRPGLGPSHARQPPLSYKLACISPRTFRPACSEQDPRGACTEPFVALRAGSADVLSQSPRTLRGSEWLGR